MYSIASRVVDIIKCAKKAFPSIFFNSKPHVAVLLNN